jgi:hypothetical protein
MIDAARASAMVICLTDDSVEHKTITWESHHLPGALVDNTFNATEYLEGSSAIACHLYVEKKSTIAILGIEGCSDLFTIADFHNHPWLEIETLRRRFL